MGSGHADKAALVSAAGDSVWAKTPGFEVRTLLQCIGGSILDAGGTGGYDGESADIYQVSPAEMKNIVAALAGGAAADKLWTDGLHVAGERYVVFKVEGRSIYGRKVSFFPIPPLFAARLRQGALGSDRI